MPEKGGKLSQTTLLLRLLCGGYLIYLGGSLLKDGVSSALFTGAAIVFIAVGAVLLGFTLRTIWKDWKEGKNSDQETE